MADESHYPLVTFALFAYNQEKYIGEAVRGAFAQDYPNLEIIISDDDSTDGTWSEIERLVSGYSGKHSFSIRRNDCNLGLFKHVLEAARTARGELVVLAAADDISKPERVSRIVSEWRKTDAWAFHSRYDTVNEEGELLAEDLRTEELFAPTFDLKRYFSDDHGEIGIVHGATSAYVRQVFELLDGYDPPWILSEDGMFSLILAFAKNPVAYINESLVRYRVHDGALTNVRATELRTHAAIQAHVQKSKIYAASCRNRALFFLEFVSAHGSEGCRQVSYNYVNRDIARQCLRAKWDQVSLFERLRYLALTPKDWVWLLPRLFGIRVYIWQKLLRSRLNGKRPCF